jgi:hypothetical protein
MPQVTVRLPTGIRREFAAYAESCGLDASELARLLLRRELRVRRIEKKHPRTISFDTVPASQNTKLTAHFHSDAWIRDFDTYARRCGYSRAVAARLVFENELEERWLAKALSWDG